MYSIVHFTETKEVAVVPNIWISDGGTGCWWPNYRTSERIRTAAIKREKVDKSKYVHYKVRVMKEFGSWDAARRMLAQAEIDSDLNSDSESTPKSRRAKTYPLRLQAERELNSPISQDSSDEDIRPSHRLGLVVAGSSNTTSMLPPPPPFELTAGNETSVPSSPRFEAGFSEETGISNAPLTGINDLCPPNETAQNEVAKLGFQNWMIRQIGIIKAQLKNLQEGQDVLIDARNREPQSKRARLDNEEHANIRGLLPIKTLESMDSFLDLIAEDDAKSAVIEKLCLRGGTNANDCVRRILSEMMSDDVAINYSWLGSRNGKRSFSNTLLKSIIYEAVRRTRKMSETQDSQIEEAVKGWLKYAKKRIEAKQKIQGAELPTETDGDSN